MSKKSTKIIIPSITFNYTFRTKKKARIEALKTLLSAVINGDKQISNQIRVEKLDE